MTEKLSREDLREAIRPRNFDPADAEVVGFMDIRPPQPPRFEGGLPGDIARDIWNQMIADFQQRYAEWRARNVELFGREFPGGRCEHCGANIRWAGIVRYLPTGQHFVVGETCADERMTLVNRAGYDLRLLKKKEEARAAREALALSQLEWMTTYPAEAEYLLSEDRAYNEFFDSLKDKYGRYGALSEKQTATITRQIVRDAERQARFAERDALLANTPALAEGRYEIEGRVAPPSGRRATSVALSRCWSSSMMATGCGARSPRRSSLEDLRAGRSAGRLHREGRALRRRRALRLLLAAEQGAVPRPGGGHPMGTTSSHIPTS